LLASLPHFLQLHFKGAYRKDQLIELLVNTWGTPLRPFFQSVLRVLSFTDYAHDSFLEGFSQLQHHHADLETLSFGVVQKILTEVHVATSSAHEYTTTFHLDLFELRADQVHSICAIDLHQGQTCGQLVDQALILLL